MRLVVMVSAVLVATAGCSTAMTSFSPYVQPEGPSTASVRFRVENISRWGKSRLTAVMLYNFADEQCGESAQGRYIDEIGKDKFLVSRANQSIGMPKPQEYPPYSYVERRFVAESPLVFSVIVASGGPRNICQASYQFVPSAGRMYEVAIDVLDVHVCPIRVVELELDGGSVISTKELAVNRLPQVCESPSFLN